MQRHLTSEAIHRHLELTESDVDRCLESAAVHRHLAPGDVRHHLAPTAVHRLFRSAAEHHLLSQLMQLDQFCSATLIIYLCADGPRGPRSGTITCAIPDALIDVRCACALSFWDGQLSHRRSSFLSNRWNDARDCYSCRGFPRGENTATTATKRIEPHASAVGACEDKGRTGGNLMDFDNKQLYT